MSKKKNHSWWFAVINKPSEITGKVTVSLCYKYEKRKVFKTPIKIPSECWDDKAKRIKILAKYSHLNLQEYNDLLLTYKGRIAYVRREMAEGNMTYTTAVEYILKIEKEELLVDYLVPEHWKGSSKAVKKHGDRLRAIENYLLTTELKDLVPLSFSVMSDEATVTKLGNAIKNNPKISVNTSHDYMSTLNAICGKQSKNNKPFTNLDLMPSKEDTYGSNPVAYVDVLQALNKVNSKQQYEAVIFWLYMFCLTGIDAVDIANTSEDNFDKDDLKHIKEKGLMHYHPESMFKGFIEPYSRKLYRLGKRAKSNQSIGGTMFNLFPTLLLHKVLKRLIKETHPEYAYNGKDCIRMFNFLTRDKNGKYLKEGDDKWTAYRGVMSKNLKKLGMGNGLKQVRDTFTMQGENLGVSKEKLQEYLGHKLKKEVITHYRSPSQIEKDTYHSQILEGYNIVGLTKTVLEVGEQFGYLPKNTIKPYLTKDELNMLEKEKLNSWSYEEELTLQRLLKAFRDNPRHEFIDGKIEIFNDENNMPPELKALIARKEMLTLDRDIDKFEKWLEDTRK